MILVNGQSSYISSGSTLKLSVFNLLFIKPLFLFESVH